MNHTEEMCISKVHLLPFSSLRLSLTYTGERIVAVGKVPHVDRLRRSTDVKVINGRGRTLMSGLGDAHAHLTWNDNALELLGDVGVEEHTLITIKSAKCYIDSGYTMYVQPE